MPQKRKSHQSKLERGAALLRQLEQKTTRAVKPHLGDNWRDNLFEIMMTRLELAAKDKTFLASLPAELRQTPAAAPEFARTAAGTLSRILTLAMAPSTPVHVAAFGVLYLHVIRTFLRDETRDMAKTMAALDKSLGHFERFCEFAPCK